MMRLRRSGAAVIAALCACTAASDSEATPVLRADGDCFVIGGDESLARVVEDAHALDDFTRDVEAEGDACSEQLEPLTKEDLDRHTLIVVAVSGQSGSAFDTDVERDGTTLKVRAELDSPNGDVPAVTTGFLDALRVDSTIDDVELELDRG